MDERFVHVCVPVCVPVILEEMQRTACRPREVCVEVNKEYPENTSHFYLPRCVALLRCGGCCNHEALYCTNTSHTHANKTVRNTHTNAPTPHTPHTVVLVVIQNVI